jgi:hypothetical protein
MPVDMITRYQQDPGKAEWERLVDTVAKPLATSLFEPIWKGSSDTVDTVEKQAIVPIQLSTKPELHVPPSMDHTAFEEGKVGLTNFLQPVEITDFATDIDDLVHDLLITLARDSTNYVQAKRQFFDLERKWSDQKEAEKTAELQSQVDSAKTVNTWGRVEQSLASVGLIASGIIGLVAAPTGIGAVLGASAIVVGGVLLVEQLLDDAAKKMVASWIAPGNQEEQAVWVNRMQLFCGLGSFALSLGASPSSALQVALNVSKGVVNTTKDVFEYRLSVQRSVVMELDAESRLAQKSVDTLFSEIQEICNTIYQFHENLHHIEEKRQQVAHSMLRFADA